MLRITPLYGSHFNPYGEAEEPTCTFIELSRCRCLINVGYNPSFWNNLIYALTTSDGVANRIPDHDCVFIMNSTWQCVAGLPLYYEYMQTQYNNGAISFIPPIYATYPTIKMGQMTLYDYHATIAMDGNSPPFTLQSIDNVFASMTAIKFSQQIFLSSSSEPASSNQSSGPQLSVTAHRAGYVVGGAYFVIQRLSDETVIVFTDSTYHMSKELHLESCTLLQHGTTTPDVFITRPGGPPFRQIRALYTNDGRNNTSDKSTKQKQKLLQQPLVAQAERHLIENILSVLRRDGNVLLPVDTSGRVLELLLLLHYEWEQQRYMNVYNLIYYAPMCHNVLDYAKSQLEWMSNALNTQFADYGKHPYRFTAASASAGASSTSNARTIQVCTSLSELNTILEDHQNPSCVLASGLSLEGGPSRDVLLKWADNPDNAIIFTDSSQCYVRRTFFDNSRSSSMAMSSSSRGGTIEYASGNVAQETESLLERTQKPLDSAISFTNDNVVATSESTVSVGTSTMVATPLDNTETEEADDNVTNIGEALTDQTKSIWTTAGQLLHAWVQAKAMGMEMADSVTVDVNVPIRAPLAGVELKTFLAQEEAKRQAYLKAAEKRAMLAQVELAKGQLHLGEDDAVPPTTASSSTDAAKLALNATSSSSNARGNVRPKKKSRFDSSLFLKYSKPLHMTFDIREEAVGLGQPDSVAKYGIGESVGRSGEVLEDDYGISVEADRFTDIVSGVDPSKFAGGSGRIGDEVKRRGLGYDLDNIGNRKTKSATTSNSGTSRIVSDVDEQEDDADSLNEHAQEALDLSEGFGIIRGRNGRLPTKVSTVPRKFEVLAEISYVPGLEGRVDARAARQSIRALQPREVVILGGIRDDSAVAISEKSIDNNLVTDEVGILAEAAQSFVKGSKNIWTPSDSETIQLDVGHSAYSVRLIDKPYRSADMMDTGSEVNKLPESIEPLEIKLGICNISLVDCVATGQKVALDGSIVLAPRMPSFPHIKDDDSAIYLSDGEILLTDLRTELIALGMKAEYSSHTGYSQLLVNGKIILRKVQNQDGIGRMQIEGPLCEDFYTVRSILCGQYVTL